MIILSILRVFGREGFKGFSRALGVFWMFLSRIAFGLFEAFLAEYVDLTFPFLNSGKKMQGFFPFFFFFSFKLNHYKITTVWNHVEQVI